MTAATGGPRGRRPFVTIVADRARITETLIDQPLLRRLGPRYAHG